MSSSVLIARTLALRQGIHSLSDYRFYLNLSQMVISDRPIGQFHHPIRLILPITRNQDTAVPCPYNRSRDAYIRGG
ncbi:hypothetical protein [Microcoleus sp. D3_18a_C4]|uniref:hypothetical protein n=1 Tax=unclassified Microcoleus TaxID=2642155 RepID=UPI002FD6C736